MERLRRLLQAAGLRTRLPQGRGGAAPDTDQGIPGGNGKIMVKSVFKCKNVFVPTGPRGGKMEPVQGRPEEGEEEEAAGHAGGPHVGDNGRRQTRAAATAATARHQQPSSQSRRP